MAYHIRDWGSIEGSGGPIPIGYRIGTGSILGMQPRFAEAVPQNDGASLVNNGYTVELAGGQYTRYFWLRNETATPTSFTLSGGLATWGSIFYIQDYGSIAGFGGPIPIAFTIQGGAGGQSPLAYVVEAFPQNDGASLVSTDRTVELAAGRYTHYFWLRNETGTPTSFTLTGGAPA